MGMYRWNPEMIYFMNQASKDTEYYKELAEHIAKYLTKDSVVCDVGCGVGGLAIELSRFCRKVYAVDISKDIIDSVKERLEEERIMNVEAICTDVFGWKPEEKVDAAVYCMFGTVEEINRIGKHLEVSQQFIVRRLVREHQFKIKEGKQHRNSAPEMMEELRESDYQFEYEEMTLSLNQPFKNFDEAVRFFELYNRTKEKITEEEIEARLIRQENEEYPYLLPSKKRMGIIQYFM
ncbi:MAG: class I SAM-dependent methyltransferase [Ruminococcus sp.]|nr:class I SAM-dependent methyltransferase [Ruminococcus sp.]